MCFDALYQITAIHTLRAYRYIYLIIYQLPSKLLDLIHTRHLLRTTNIYMSKMHLTLYLRQLHGSIPTGNLKKPKREQHIDKH